VQIDTTTEDYALPLSERLQRMRVVLGLQPAPRRRGAWLLGLLVGVVSVALWRRRR
jgi:hypothetical protein